MDDHRLAVVEVLFSKHSRIRYSMGFVVIDEYYDSNYADIDQEVIDQIVKHMGFNGLQDYANAFVIESPENSVINGFYNIYENRCRDMESLISGYQIVIYRYNNHHPGDGPIAKNLLFTIKTRAKQLNNNSFMFPILMDDIKKTVGCKRIPKKDLWFCTDWEGGWVN